MRTAQPAASGHSELLLLPDGRLLVHNLTPLLAALLAELSPDKSSIRDRAGLVPLFEADSAPLAETVTLNSEP